MRDRALEPEIARLLAEYPVVVTTMVAWADMDANEHANHGAFFRYVEHARLKYFHELGLLRMQRSDGIGPILSWIDCRFRLALKYPDHVSIGARVSELGTTSFTMHGIVVSHELRAIAAESQARTVCFDYNKNEKTAIPDDVLKRMQEIQGTLPRAKQ